MEKFGSGIVRIKSHAFSTSILFSCLPNATMLSQRDEGTNRGWSSRKKTFMMSTVHMISEHSLASVKQEDTELIAS